MVEFKTYRAFWDFEHSVTRSWRYFRSDAQFDFLQTILSTSSSRAEIMPNGTILWRAQQGYDWRKEEIEPGDSNEYPVPFPAERMKPQRDRAKEGRANPKGIPYLYASTHQVTAISEVRPWVGAMVSVAQLKIRRELRIINCTSDDRRLNYFEEPDPAEREKRVWKDIDDAFSRPVTPTDDIAHYVPTQIIAEQFRESGFDGIGYRSSLGPGHNIVIFNLDAADIISCRIAEIKKLCLQYDVFP